MGVIGSATGADANPPRREFNNSRLGLSVLMPAGWESSSIEDFAELRDRQVVQDEVAHSTDDVHPLKDPAVRPLFIFEDANNREGEFAPAICLYDGPLYGPAPADELSAHERMLSRFASSYRDLKVIETPATITVRGATGTYSRWSYTHEIQSGWSCSLEVRTLLVFRPPRVHTYYLVDASTSPRIDGAVWDSFMESIQYAPPPARSTGSDYACEREGEMSSEDILFELVDGIQAKEATGGYESLTPAEQVFYCIWTIEAEVNNGGFEQFFTNGSGDIALHAPAAFEAIGATYTASLMEQANALFGAGGPPADRCAREEMVEKLDEAALERLEELDTAFLAYEDDLSELLAAYMKLNSEA